VLFKISKDFQQHYHFTKNYDREANIYKSFLIKNFYLTVFLEKKIDRYFTTFWSLNLEKSKTLLTIFFPVSFLFFCINKQS